MVEVEGCAQGNFRTFIGPSTFLNLGNQKLHMLLMSFENGEHVAILGEGGGTFVEWLKCHLREKLLHVWLEYLGPKNSQTVWSNTLFKVLMSLEAFLKKANVETCVGVEVCDDAKACGNVAIDKLLQEISGKSVACEDCLAGVEDCKKCTNGFIGPEAALCSACHESGVQATKCHDCANTFWALLPDDAKTQVSQPKEVQKTEHVVAKDEQVEAQSIFALLTKALPASAEDDTPGTIDTVIQSLTGCNTLSYEEDSWKGIGQTTVAFKSNCMVLCKDSPHNVLPFHYDPCCDESGMDDNPKIFSVESASYLMVPTTKAVVDCLKMRASLHGYLQFKNDQVKTAPQWAKALQELITVTSMEALEEAVGSFESTHGDCNRLCELQRDSVAFRRQVAKLFLGKTLSMLRATATSLQSSYQACNEQLESLLPQNATVDVAIASGLMKLQQSQFAKDFNKAQRAATAMFDCKKIVLAVKGLVDAVDFEEYMTGRKSLTVMMPGALGLRHSLTIAQAVYQQLPNGDENASQRANMVARAWEIIQLATKESATEGRPRPDAPHKLLLGTLQALHKD